MLYGSLSRREFVIAMLGLAGMATPHSHTRLKNKKPDDYYKLKNFGSIRILHITDPHAQLLPVYYREPSINIGLYNNWGKPPHITGKNFLKFYGIEPKSRYAYAFTCIDFAKDALKYGKMGGYAHIKYLADYLRESFGRNKTLFLDGGDTWQGSATALYSRGQDMVGAQNLLGIDVMTGHWDFTYPEKRIIKNIKKLKAEFLAQNVFVKDEALLSGAASYDDQGHAFKPYTIKELKGNRIAVIGQAFPYTPIANPQRFIPDWSFGIHADTLSQLVKDIRMKEKPDAIILLSHNGFDVDKKLARIVSGIDFISGGHTHDGVPEAVPVKNSSGTTYITNAGTNGKFLGVLDISIKNHRVDDFRFTLLPVFSDLLPEDKQMRDYIKKVRKPYIDELSKKLVTTEQLLYRRGNFNGSFDQIICDALMEVNDAEIALSPGFRWGTTVIPGKAITVEDVMNQTAITYPETYTREMKGSVIKAVLEDVADNLFNRDPFLQQGGDMVRTGGISYTIAPLKSIGNRISDLRLANGKKIEPDKNYKVTGWATVKSKAAGEPIWKTVIKYLDSHKNIANVNVNTPDIVGIKNNPGIDRGCM